MIVPTIPAPAPVVQGRSSVQVLETGSMATIRYATITKFVPPLTARNFPTSLSETEYAFKTTVAEASLVVPVTLDPSKTIPFEAFGRVRLPFGREFILFLSC